MSPTRCARAFRNEDSQPPSRGPRQEPKAVEHNKSNDLPAEKSKSVPIPIAQHCTQRGEVSRVLDRPFCSSYWTALMITLPFSSRLSRELMTRKARRPVPKAISSRRSYKGCTLNMDQVETGVTSSDYLLAFLIGTRRALTAAGRRTALRLRLSSSECDPAACGLIDVTIVHAHF